MPRPFIQRGEMWVVDPGYLGKVRPVVVISVPLIDTDRTLIVVVPHTTSVAATRFEVVISQVALQQGAFDVQQIAAVPAAKFIRRLGLLTAQQLEVIERRIADLLGLKLAR